MVGSRKCLCQDRDARRIRGEVEFQAVSSLVTICGKTKTVVGARARTGFGSQACRCCVFPLKNWPQMLAGAEVLRSVRHKSGPVPVCHRAARKILRETLGVAAWCEGIRPWAACLKEADQRAGQQPGAALPRGAEAVRCPELEGVRDRRRQDQVECSVEAARVSPSLVPICPCMMPKEKTFKRNLNPKP